jgi:dihydropteroate synthase
LLLGASRKSFIARVAAETAAADRLAGSLACACWGIGHGIDIVRTHDVGATRQAVRVAAAILKNTR